MKNSFSSMAILFCFLIAGLDHASAAGVSKKKQAAYDKCNHLTYMCKSGCGDYDDADELDKCLKKCNRRHESCTGRIKRIGDADVPAEGSSGDAGVLESP
jgi:hypothetical protein